MARSEAWPSSYINIGLLVVILGVTVGLTVFVVHSTSALNARMDAMEASLGGVEREAAGLREDVAALKTDVATLKTTVSGMARDMGEGMLESGSNANR